MSYRAFVISAAVFSSTVLPLCGRRAAEAVPILQLYLEGGTYNTATESWELTHPGSSSGAPFRLWVIGNVDGPGGKGTIFDVRLSLGVSEEAFNNGITISITGSQAGGVGVGEFDGVLDPSVASDPALKTNQLVDTSSGAFLVGGDGFVTNGGSPVLSTGKKLPSHGVYGAGTVWQEWSLGDFDKTDSHVGDFIGEFPSELSPESGQINAYEVSVLNGHGFTVHFDGYNHVAGKTGAKFAPFSHDGDADSNIVPEPGSVIVWMLMGLTWAGGAWRMRFVRRWKQMMEN